MRPGSGQHQVNGGDRVGAGRGERGGNRPRQPASGGDRAGGLRLRDGYGHLRGDGTELFYARCAVLHAARVAGIAAYDVVWSDINNEEGFLAEANLAKNLGFNGKSLVNPRQIELLHQVYAPTRKEVDHALEVIAAAEEAETRGLGVVSLNGKMIDGPIIDHARKVVALSASGIRD